MTHISVRVFSTKSAVVVKCCKLGRVPGVATGPLLAKQTLGQGAILGKSCEAAAGVACFLKRAGFTTLLHILYGSETTPDIF